jgi:protocatechuate 3,4-dioxygenase, alpha subunit
MDQRQTPSQTVGPFFGVGLTRTTASRHVLVTNATEGERIRIEGQVFDGAGNGIEDALVEIWQANAHGRYRHPLDTGPAALDPSFTGFGRCPTGANGAFAFDTIKPGAIAAPHAPHINVIVFSRGMLVHAFTRVYFSDDERGGDPVLARVDADRRGTLVAERHVTPHRHVVYRWNIQLQGERETVFFDA